MVFDDDRIRLMEIPKVINNSLHVGLEKDRLYNEVTLVIQLADLNTNKEFHGRPFGYI